MTPRSEIDFDFRPSDYWSPDNWPKHILANISGALRQQHVRQLLEDGRGDAIEEWLLSEELAPDVRESAGALHPWLMGGEYLPRVSRDQVEIARITLRSTTMDVISLRARKTKSRIRYRVDHEYEFRYKIRPASSSAPLTLRQLIELIDTALPEGEAPGSRFQGLVFGPLYMNLMADASPQDLLGFVMIDSEFYPHLAEYYRGAIKSYLEHWKSPADLD